MIKRILSGFAGLLSCLVFASAALAQSSPGLTYGQVPTAGQWNSYFAGKADYPITTNTITNSLGYVPLNAALAPNRPVVHPSSGNNTCAYGHYLAFVDQNQCWQSDQFNWSSTDPSALMIIEIGGTVTTGDRVNLTWTFGSGPCIGGCTVGYTAVGGDDLGDIATGLVAAMKANAAIFTNPNGGYSSGALIGYIHPPGSPGSGAAQIAIDFDARIATKLVPGVTGSATETVAISDATCATQCTAKYDVNPTFLVGRLIAGKAPPPGSALFQIQAVGNSSASLNAYDVQYANLSVEVQNSTMGALQSRWFLTTPDANGVHNQGIYIGDGLYTVNQNDNGVDTITANVVHSEYFQVDQLAAPGLGVQYGTAPTSDYWRFTPPPTAGTTGQILTSNGGGYNNPIPMSWLTPPAGALVGTTATQTLTNKSIDAGQLTGSIAAARMPALTGDVTTSAGAVATTIAADAVTNAKLADMAATTLKGNATGGAANPTDLTLGAGLSFSGSTVRVTPGQIPGTTTNDAATAGNVGEYISSSIPIGSAVSLTTGTPANITSISLTAGDWDVWATVNTDPNAATVTTTVAAAISGTSAAFPAAPGEGAYLYVFLVGSAGTSYNGPVGFRRITLASTTTIYLVGQAQFSVNTNKMFGFLGARRVR